MTRTIKSEPISKRTLQQANISRLKNLYKVYKKKAVDNLDDVAKHNCYLIKNEIRNRRDDRKENAVKRIQMAWAITMM